MGALALLANENSHYVNSKMATVHYCSKRVPPYLSEIQSQAPQVRSLGKGWLGAAGLNGFAGLLA